MQWPAERNFAPCHLQVCETIRRLCRHHVVARVERSREWLSSEIVDRSDRWSALPVLRGLFAIRSETRSNGGNPSMDKGRVHYASGCCNGGNWWLPHR